MGLKQNDRIKTEINSNVTVVIEGGALFRIEENTTVQLLNLVSETEKKKKIIKSQIGIPQKGKVLSYIRKFVGTQNNHFSIKTPVCTASVRGTGLAVDVEDEETTHIAVFEGRVVVKDFVEDSLLPQDNEEFLLLFLHEISMKPNQMTTVTKKGIKKPFKLTGKMIDSQQEIADLKKHSIEIEEAWKSTARSERNHNQKKVREAAINEKR